MAPFQIDMHIKGGKRIKSDKMGTTECYWYIRGNGFAESKRHTLSVKTENIVE